MPRARGAALHQRRVFASLLETTTPARPATAECDAPPGGRSVVVDRTLLTSNSRERSIQNLNHEICIRLGDAQRRFDSKRVPIKTTFTNEES